MKLTLFHFRSLLIRKKTYRCALSLFGVIIFIFFYINEVDRFYKLQSKIKFFKAKLLANINRIENRSLTFEERVSILKHGCNNATGTPYYIYSNLIKRNDILNYLSFILRSHSLFYCSVPKVATRTLLTYITYLHVRDELLPSAKNDTGSFFDRNSNLFDTRYINNLLSTSVQNDSYLLLSRLLSRLTMDVQLNTTELDLWSIHKRSTFSYIRLRSLSNFSSIFSNSFTRMIFVRHPLERLASAYIDKITSLTQEPFSLYDGYRRRICRKFSSFYLTTAEQDQYRMNIFLEKQIDEPCRKIIPRFEHFVEFILADSSQIDVHWQPYSTLCHVCTFQYNFIGKFETIEEDLNSILFRMNLNLSSKIVPNRFSNGKNKEYYKSMYSKLSIDLICNLKNFYHSDFNLFDYRIEDYLTDQQKRNCSLRYYQRYN